MFFSLLSMYTFRLQKQNPYKKITKKNTFLKILLPSELASDKYLQCQ